MATIIIVEERGAFACLNEKTIPRIKLRKKWHETCGHCDAYIKDKIMKIVGVTTVVIIPWESVI